MNPIRVVIVEDHIKFREGLVQVLKATPGFSLEGEFGSVEDALTAFPPADVLLLDIHLPGKSGTESIAEFKKASPGVQILMVTVFEDDENVFNAIMAGADGYLLKKTHPARILTAIEDAAAGGSPMTPYIARRVNDLFRKFAPPPAAEHSLSPRELEVLQLLVSGSDNREIADKLFLSIETVRNHIRHIYEKLRVHSKAQAVAKALSERIVDRKT
jgi:DNA-binding NarL/FixJ family response regulator